MLLSSTSSLAVVVLPPLVDKTRVADLPAILKELKRWSRLDTSSPIFATDSEDMEAIVRSSQYTRSSYHKNQFSIQLFYQNPKSISFKTTKGGFGLGKVQSLSLTAFLSQTLLLLEKYYII